ncbi:hypothetical protein F4860DRAFT_506388 [Xylaria cubensis]|nr:hypothetical protein F4860DRAFT_506388 [Xylaria cubensis]
MSMDGTESMKWMRQRPQKLHAGHGGNGGDGGDGGTIEIVVHEGQAHLLMAVKANVTIVVQKLDESHQEYSSLYSLAITGFEVEDENGDGIFEPGEHLFVRRITVQNSGIMVESDWFRLVDGPDGQTFLLSIGEGSSVTIDGPIKVRIREREEYENPETGALFIRHEAIHLNAIMPWIEREILNFDFNKVIEIKYPCELRNFQALVTVAQGSQSKLSFEIYNHGSVSIGPQGYNSRVVEIDVSFPAAFGELESEPYQWRESVTITPRDIRGRKGLVLRRQLRVHSNAQNYQHVAALFKLYLGKPNQPKPDGQYEVNLIHVVEIRMQVSDHYVIHPGASFPLVTNSETVGERAQSIRRFVNNSLGMEIDTWNMSLYAGLDMKDQNSGALQNVLSRKSIFDVCDPEHEKLISEISFWPTQPISDTRANIGQSHQFHSIPDFATAIIQQKQYNSNLSHERYAITSSKKCYQAFLRPETLAKKVAKQLQRKLPTERFLVTFHASRASKQIADMSASDGLPPVEAYMIVEAFALHHRVDMLWDTVAESDGNGNVIALRLQFAMKALTVSLIYTTHREVELLLHKAPWADKLLQSNPSKHSFEELRTLFASHLPTLHAILFHPQASEVAVNSNIQSVLSYALAATQPQSKRQIAGWVLTPFYDRRRSTNAFLRAGIAMFLRKKGFTEIQMSDFFSRTNQSKRNTRVAVLRIVANLTKKSEHAVLRRKQDDTNVVHGSSYISPGGWDRAAAAAKDRSKKIAEEANEARKMLERILVS